jgi:hypothetical protein
MVVAHTHAHTHTRTHTHTITHKRAHTINLHVNPQEGFDMFCTFFGPEKWFCAVNVWSLALLRGIND